MTTSNTLRLGQDITDAEHERRFKALVDISEEQLDQIVTRYLAGELTIDEARELILADKPQVN
jgi:hypothetical protein